MAKRVIEVTHEQVELASAKVEADSKIGRTTDPMVVLVSQAKRIPVTARRRRTA